MITEDYISFDTAKLLKEKGFDLPVHYVYHYWTKAPFFHRKMKNFNGEEYRNLKNEWYSAPTQSLAMKWLREVHGLHVDIDPLEGNWRTKIVELEDLCEVDRGISLYGTYEEAAEVGIKYCLENLI